MTRIAGLDRLVPGIVGRHRADVAVRTGYRGAAGRIRPGLARIQHAVAVVPCRTADRHALVIRHHHIRQRDVSGVGHQIAPGHRVAHQHQRPGSLVGVLAVRRLLDPNRRRDEGDDRHIVVAAVQVVVVYIGDSGGQPRPQEIREHRPFRQSCERSRHGVIRVVPDDHIRVAQLGNVAVESRYVQSSAVQTDCAGHIHLVVLVVVVAGRVAADLDVQGRAQVHAVVAVLDQDARVRAGSDGRATACDHLAVDRAFARQRLAVGQDQRAGHGAVVQAGHVQEGAKPDVDRVRLGDDVVRRRVDQCQRVLHHCGGAGEAGGPTVGHQREGAGALLGQPAVGHHAQRRVVQQRPKDVRVQAAGVDQRAAVFDHAVPEQRPARAGGDDDFVDQIARRLRPERAAVETKLERVRARRTRRAVQIHAIRQQQTAHIQINRETALRDACRLEHDLPDRHHSTGQVDHAEVGVFVAQAGGGDRPAADVQHRIAIAADDQVAGDGHGPCADVRVLVRVLADGEITRHVHLRRSAVDGQQRGIGRRSHNAQGGAQIAADQERSAADIELPGRKQRRLQPRDPGEDRTRGAQRPPVDPQYGVPQIDAVGPVGPHRGGAGHVQCPGGKGQFAFGNIQDAHVRLTGSGKGQRTDAPFF